MHWNLSAVVLACIRVKLIKFRALIDPCSQVDLVSEVFVKKHYFVSRFSLSTIAGATRVYNPHSQYL